MSGSIGGLTLNGLPFDVANDADLTEIFCKFKVEPILTSGVASFSKEKQSQTVSGVVVILKKGDKALLAELNDSDETYTMSYKQADGTKLSAVGRINVESNTTMKNATTLSLIPEDSWLEQIA